MVSLSGHEYVSPGLTLNAISKKNSPLSTEKQLESRGKIYWLCAWHTWRYLRDLFHKCLLTPNGDAKVTQILGLPWLSRRKRLKLGANSMLGSVHYLIRGLTTLQTCHRGLFSMNVDRTSLT